MERIAPVGNVYQAGTLSGNPVAMAAGYTLLKLLKQQSSIYQELDEKTSYLEKGLRTELEKMKIAHRINKLGSMISLHFCDHDVTDFHSAGMADIAFFNAFFHQMLKRGIYLPPSAYETWFLSNALTYHDLDKTVNAAGEALEELVKAR